MYISFHRFFNILPILPVFKVLFFSLLFQFILMSSSIWNMLMLYFISHLCTVYLGYVLFIRDLLFLTAGAIIFPFDSLLPYMLCNFEISVCFLRLSSSLFVQPVLYEYLSLTILCLFLPVALGDITVPRLIFMCSFWFGVHDPIS